MISFRETNEDCLNIDEIKFAFGLQSTTEVFRFALKRLAKEKPTVAILPQLPPIVELDLIVATLQRLERTWLEAIRVGWPEHLSGESLERKEKVDAARKMYEQALAEFQPGLAQAKVLLVALRCAPAIDLKTVKAAARELNKFREGKLAASNDPAKPPEFRKRAKQSADFWKPLIELLQQAGIVVPEV